MINTYLAYDRATTGQSTGIRDSVNQGALKMDSGFGGDQGPPTGFKVGADGNYEPVYGGARGDLEPDFQSTA